MYLMSNLFSRPRNFDIFTSTNVYSAYGIRPQTLILTSRPQDIFFIINLFRDINIKRNFKAIRKNESRLLRKNRR